MPMTITVVAGSIKPRARSGAATGGQSFRVGQRAVVVVRVAVDHKKFNRQSSQILVSGTLVLLIGSIAGSAGAAEKIAVLGLRPTATADFGETKLELLGEARSLRGILQNVIEGATGASLLDDRFSLYSNADPGPDLLLFNEGDTSGVYTHELYLASVAVVDRTLSGAEVAALGGPQAEGIFVQHLHVARNTNDLLLTWNGAPNIRLQKTTTLAPADWHDVTDTLGTNRFTEIAPQGDAFYRLLRQ